MRPIMFRVWHKEGKEFVSIQTMGWRFDPQNGQMYVNGMNVTGRVVIQQYTGLQDKNGKDIYEGDILRIAEWKMNGEVNFASGMFKVRDRRRENFNPSLASFMVEIRCEVIGNIWENADLLRDSAIESTEQPKP